MMDIEELKKKADAGDAEARCELGVLYEKGHGVPQDYYKAKTLYSLAAQQGNMRAAYHLGLMNEYGRGMKNCLTRAKQWYLYAATGGDELALEACRRLGVKVEE